MDYLIERYFKKVASTKKVGVPSIGDGARLIRVACMNAARGERASSVPKIRCMFSTFSTAARIRRKRKLPSIRLLLPNEIISDQR